jgi:hypothetical protein
MLKETQPKTFIQKIFELLKKFINWASQNKSYVDGLFSDIKSGVYKDAKQVKNEFYQKPIAVFKTLSFEEDYQGKKRTRTLDSRTTSNVVNKILKKAFDLSKTTNVTDVDIKNLIESLKDNYYTESNFEELFKLSTAAKVQSAKKQLAQINNALSNPKNITEIVKDVKNLLSMYSIVDYTLEPNEDQDTQDAPTEFFAKEVSTIGGIGSLSKEMRKYLQFIPSPIDEFDLGVNIDPSSEFVSYADSYELYNGIARILANRKPSDIIKALYSQSKTNKQLNYFTLQLFSDIAKDLNLTNYSPSEIANLNLLKLENSTTFQMFVANFRKNKIDYISITPDVESNKFKLFRSNINDVKDIQVNSWGNANLSNPVSNEEQIRLIDLNRNIFENIEKGDDVIKTLEQFLKKVDSINNNLKALHVNVSDLYIRMSLFNAMPNKNDLAAMDEEGTFSDLAETLSVYPEINYLTGKVFSGMKSATEKGGSIYEKTEKKDSGAIGTLKNIAEGNSYFDFSVIPTTFKNIEGKTIYSYIQPNYITDIVNSMKESPEVVINALNDPEFESGFSAFKSFLIANNLESNDFLERKFFTALRYNPQLTSVDASTFITGLNTFVLDGSRVVTLDDNYNEVTYLSNDDGKSFQSLDPRGKILTYFMLYSTEGGRNTLAKNVNGVEFVPYIPFQNEGKSTQWATLMPKVKDFYSEGRMSTEAYDKIFKLFEMEHNNLMSFFKSIKDDETLPKVKGVTEFKDEDLKAEVVNAITNNDLNTLLEIYKDNKKYSKLPRAMKFSNIEYLLLNDNLDYLIQASLEGYALDINDQVKGSINTLMNSIFNESLELLSSDNIKLINKLEGEKYSNILLPREFLFDNGDVNLSKLKNFLINDYINSASFINMLVGDMAFNFKDPIDFPKRMAGLNASGPSLGFTKTNISIINDVEGILVDLETNKVSSKDRTDGQSYSTQTWYEKKYLKTFKKWNPEIERIYKKMRKCQKLSWSEKQLLEDYGALANSRKIAMFNYAVYGKTSINPIVRNEVSYVKPENYKAVNSLVDRLYAAETNEEYNSILKKLHTYYEAYPHTKKMHDLLNKMEKGNVDISLSESAVKTVIYNTQNVDDVDSLEGFTIGDTYIREQVVTDNMKTKIVDGTQLLQLIDSEQKSGTKVYVFDKEYDIETIVSVFKRSKEYRIKQKYEELKKSYVENNKPRYKALLKSFKESLLNMGTDPIMLELLSATENLDSSKFNWNMNKTINTVEKMLYSYLSESLSHKVAGQKFTLLTDDAYKVVEDSNGNIVTIENFKNNPIENYTTRDLEIKWDNIKKCYYAECVISPQTAYRYGLKPGDTVGVDSKLFEYIGTRIPTQDKSSMAYIKIIDYLPAEKGNSIILPFEVMYYSGADFDIDSLFAQTYEVYEDDNKEVIYGDYLNIEDKDERIKAAFKEYYKEASKAKSVKADYDKFLETDEKLANYYEETEYTENVLKLASMRNIYDLANFVSQELSDYEETFKELIKTKDNFLDILSQVLKESSAVEIREENIKTLKDLYNKIQSRKEALLKMSLVRNGYISTVEEFEKDPSMLKKVNNNYQAIKSGNLLEYKPITSSETNNLMVELKSVLIRNSGNQEASKRDVEREDAEKLTKLLEQYGINDPTKIAHYSSLTSKVKMSIANAVGGKNIGIAALGNIMAQYLIKNKAVIGKVGIASDFKWMKGQGESINKILSLWISLGVDNAKHQDAGRFSITSQMQSVLVFDAIINKDNPTYSSKHIMSLGIVPEVKKMLNEISFLSDKFKTKGESKLEGTKQEILTAFYKPTAINWNNLTLDQILENIKKIQNGETVDPDFQQAALNKVIDLMRVADYAFPFTQIMGLIKGNKPTTAENLQLLDSLKDIGIEIKNGELVNTDEHKYIVANNEDDAPIDFLSIINSDPLLKTEILTFDKINKDAGLFLISASDYGQKVYKEILKNLKKSFTFNEGNVKRLIYLINNSLAFNVIRHEQSLNNIKSADTFEYITDSPEDLPRYIKYFNDLKASPLLRNNYLLSNLKPSFVEGREGSPLDGKTVHYISTNSRLNISPNMKKKIADDMYDLFVGNVFNEDGSLNEDLSKKSKFVISMMVNQIYQKDSGLFLNETLLPYTEPFFLNNYSGALDKVQQAIRGEITFEEVMGISKDEFINRFKENYMRDFNNSINIRGNRIDFIFNNIKNALKKGASQLSEKETEEFKDIIDKINNMDENPKQEDYDLISPIKFNEDRSKFTLSISPEFSKENKTTWFFDKERVQTLGSLYRSALAKTGLVNHEYEFKGDKVVRKTVFLDYLVISTKQGNKTEKRYYKRVNEGTWKAEYVEVSPFGSKAFLHYFRTPQENEQIYAKKVSKPKQGVQVTTSNYTRETVESNPETAYVFTENTHSITAFPNRPGGGSAVIRGLKNAFGIVTKKKYDYNTRENVDYSDTEVDFKEFVDINSKLIGKLKNSGKSNIVFPKGFAVDKAKMPTRFALWLQKALLDNFGLVTELNSTKTGLISKSVQSKPTQVKPTQAPTEQPVKSSALVEGLYNFLNDINLFKSKSLNINSIEDFKKNFSQNVNKVFDMIQSSGKYAMIKNRAVNGESFGDSKAVFPGSEEFLKFAEAYEKNKLNEIINKCKI